MSRPLDSLPEVWEQIIGMASKAATAAGREWGQVDKLAMVRVGSDRYSVPSDFRAVDDG